ncbi:MAG: hypothetical protein Q8N73_00255, partial [bacterium]|nr:hypothetical protein [bacterium]
MPGGSPATPLKKETQVIIYSCRSSSQPILGSSNPNTASINYGSAANAVSGLICQSVFPSLLFAK